MSKPAGLVVRCCSLDMLHVPWGVAKNCATGRNDSTSYASNANQAP